MASLNCMLLTVDAGKMSFLFAVVARFYFYPETSGKRVNMTLGWSESRLLIGAAGAVLGAELTALIRQ